MDPRRVAAALGRRGGKARARRLSSDERRRIASLGGYARRRSLQMARRIQDNLRYAAAVIQLRGRPVGVKRVTDFSGRLPGIYPDGT